MSEGVEDTWGSWVRKGGQGSKTYPGNVRCLLCLAGERHHVDCGAQKHDCATSAISCCFAAPLPPSVGRTLTRLDAVFCPESYNAPEALGTVRDQRQPQRQGMCDNQGVERADGLAAVSQRGRDRAEAHFRGCCFGREIFPRQAPRHARNLSGHSSAVSRMTR